MAACKIVIASVAAAGAMTSVAGAVSAIGAGVALSMDGISLGASVGAGLSAFGTPDLVETTDQGQEWRWFDARGIDVDLLTDDALVVHEVLVSQPHDMGGKPSGLVQPKEYPLLGDDAATADRALEQIGALRQPQLDPRIGIWRTGDGYLVLEMEDGVVRRLLALDSDSAARFGYAGASTQRSLGEYRAPRLIRQFAVDYPKRAIDEGAQGVVVVRADISKTGTVGALRVVVSSGNADIDAAESLSIQRSVFRPAQCNGDPCPGVFLDREEYTLTR